MRSKRFRQIVSLITVAAVFVLFIYLQNNRLVKTMVVVESNNVPEAFDGYKIVHLSDLHGKTFGENQERLVSLIKNENPDLIVFTGDLVDSRHFEDEDAITLLREITKITDVYYVSGNHEKRINYEALKVKIRSTGTINLDEDSATITKGNEEIAILGIEDYGTHHSRTVVDEQLKALEEDVNQEFRILLAHQPDYYEEYQGHNIDLVFSGHAHGGQFRLPFIGGVIAPGQGFNPEYDSGVFTNGDSTMVVSRGLGNSIIPVRLFNHPEVVIVTLANKTP